MELIHTNFQRLFPTIELVYCFYFSSRPRDGLSRRRHRATTSSENPSLPTDSTFFDVLRHISSFQSATSSSQLNCAPNTSTGRTLIRRHILISPNSLQTVPHTRGEGEKQKKANACRPRTGSQTSRRNFLPAKKEVLFGSAN